MLCTVGHNVWRDSKENCMWLTVKVPDPVQWSSAMLFKLPVMWECFFFFLRTVLCSVECGFARPEKKGKKRGYKVPLSIRSVGRKPSWFKRKNEKKVKAVCWNVCFSLTCGGLGMRCFWNICYRTNRPPYSDEARARIFHGRAFEGKGVFRLVWSWNWEPKGKCCAYLWLTLMPDEAQALNNLWPKLDRPDVAVFVCCLVELTESLHAVWLNWFRGFSHCMAWVTVLFHTVWLDFSSDQVGEPPTPGGW